MDEQGNEFLVRLEHLASLTGIATNSHYERISKYDISQMLLDLFVPQHEYYQMEYSVLNAVDCALTQRH